MLKVEFLVGVDAPWANASEKMEMWAKSEDQAPRFFFLKLIDTEHLITMPSATAVPILHINIQVRKIAFPPF